MKQHLLFIFLISTLNAFSVEYDCEVSGIFCPLTTHKLNSATTSIVQTCQNDFEVRCELSDTELSCGFFQKTAALPIAQGKISVTTAQMSVHQMLTGPSIGAGHSISCKHSPLPNPLPKEPEKIYDCELWDGDTSTLIDSFVFDSSKSNLIHKKVKDQFQLSCFPSLEEIQCGEWMLFGFFNYFMVPYGASFFSAEISNDYSKSRGYLRCNEKAVSSVPTPITLPMAITQWSKFAAPPPTVGLYNAHAYWIGSEVILWNGYQGALFNPQTDTWTALAPLMTPIYSTSDSVWTGQELIYWRGDGQGFRYSFPSDSWVQLIPHPQIPIQESSIASIDKQTLAIFGGNKGGTHTSDGYLLDLATEKWTKINSVDAPSPRSQAVLVSTGEELIVWGGIGKDNIELSDGGIYHIKNDTWRALPLKNAPHGRSVSWFQFFPSIVWTGEELIIWGGYSIDFGFSNSGSRYSVKNNTWHPINQTGAPSPRIYSSTVWNGQEMIIWGGQARREGLTNIGYLYNPKTDSWRIMDKVGAASARTFHSAVWGPNAMLIFGDFGDPNFPPITDPIVAVEID